MALASLMQSGGGTDSQVGGRLGGACWALFEVPALRPLPAGGVQ